MDKKVIKNQDAPGGRNDWKGRTPRWRVSLTHAQLSILMEWAEDYFAKFPEKRSDMIYLDLYERIGEHIQNIQKPLTETVHSFPLFDGTFDE